MQQINNVCVVGAGFMGRQIALQCALFGAQVRLHDANEKALSDSPQAWEATLDEMLSDGYVTPKSLAVAGNIQLCKSLEEAVSEADLVVEAIREELQVKRTVFQRLDQICPAHTILATNSSSIRISKIESATQRSELVLNTHFVQPVWKHPFVELMRGDATSDETLESVRTFMESIGMIPVMVLKESTGFVFNRIWRAVKKEALRVLDEGIASVEDIDRTWMLQMESPIGPLATMDAIGLDVVQDIELVYFEESGDPSDAPPHVLREKVSRGELGVKTGKGFYDYPNPSWKEVDFLSSPRRPE